MIRRPRQKVVLFSLLSLLTACSPYEFKDPTSAKVRDVKSDRMDRADRQPVDEEEDQGDSQPSSR
jgi:hypothetical protein